MSDACWLAIDASAQVCEVGVSTQQGSSVRRAAQAGSHARDLMTLLDEVLIEAGIEVSSLEGVVYGCGPGSFTGVRIGVAVAQGIAHAAQLPMLPISSLRNVAQQMLGSALSLDACHVAIDARMGEWYVGEFRRDAQGIAIAVGDELLVQPEQWLAQLPHKATVLAAMDTATEVHAAVAAARAIHWSTQLLMPTANVALHLAKAAVSDDWHAPQVAAASYIRDKVAKTTAERNVR